MCPRSSLGTTVGAFVWIQWTSFNMSAFMLFYNCVYNNEGIAVWYSGVFSSSIELFISWHSLICLFFWVFWLELMFDFDFDFEFEVEFMVEGSWHFTLVLMLLRILIVLFNITLFLLLLGWFNWFSVLICEILLLFREFDVRVLDFLSYLLLLDTNTELLLLFFDKVLFELVEILDLIFISVKSFIRSSTETVLFILFPIVSEEMSVSFFVYF